MAATVFATPVNNISTRLGSAHAPGSGRLSVVPGDGLKFPPLTPPAYYRVTVLHSAVAYQPYVDPANYAIFKAIQVQGDDLIVAGLLDGTADKAFVPGDVVEVRVTAGTIQDVQGAVHTLETAVAPVVSVFGRAGAVVQASGDYGVGQVTGAAPLASPAFTGNPQAPTPATADNSTTLATTAFVKAQGYSTSAGTGTVTSVGLSVPVEFAVAGSPVTTAGVIAVTKVAQAANLVYAAPAAIGGVPSFRNLTSLDLPSSVVLTGTPQAPTPATADNSTTLATTAFVKNQGYSPNTGTVSSVGLAAPAEFTVNGSPVTAAGTLTLAKAAQAAGLIYAGPATGAPAAPAFRTMVSTDIPPGVNLIGLPTATTPPAGDNSTTIATTAFVKAQAYVTAGTAPVTSVFNRAGVIVAQTGDYSVGQISGAAPIANPTFTGSVNAPTVAASDNSTLIATTGFVKAQNYLTAAPVTSFNTRTGAVMPQANDYTVSQVTGAAPLLNPGFSGIPTAPTAPPGTPTTQLATCQFVLNNVGGGVVSSVFTRVGAIVANTGDYTVGQVAGAAPLVSPAFTGTPTAPTPAPADSSPSIATTAFVKGQNYLTVAPVTSWGPAGNPRTGAIVASAGDYTVSQVTGAAPTASPTFSGIPTAPTAILGTSTIQLATCQFVMQNQATPAVSSVFGRTGAVVKSGTDYVVGDIGGAAPLDSPHFINVPRAPTAPPGTTGTQLATCDFVLANAGSGGGGGVVSWGPAGSPRTGVVIPQSGDYDYTMVSGAAPLAGPVFTGAPSMVVSPISGDNSTKIATTAFVKNQNYGSVSSVALTMPAEFGVLGSPVTTSGTLSVSKANQAANSFFAGPTSGGSVAPTFRALVAADIPSAYDATVVHLAGAETVTGVKTFSVLPVLPAQTANLVYAGPATGTAAAPAFRTLVAADFPTALLNPNPHLWGTVGFYDSTGATLHAHVDPTTGNFVNDRTDGQSVFIGASAGPVVSTGTLNTLVGYQAGAALTTGFNNTVLGAKSLANATTACNYNVGIGYFNLNGIVANCSGNVAIGEAAGNANTSGNNNTYVGTFADASGGGFSHSTALGAGAQITASNQIILGTASETVLSIAGVPYTWPTSPSAGVLTSTAGGVLTWATGGGGITNPNPTFIITTSSQFNMGGPLYFYNSSGTTRLSQIDNATGNFVNARPDTTCVFLGVNAGKNFVSATLTNNVFIGRLAGQAVTDLQSNANNTVVGSQALSQAGTISGVTAIGSQSLMSVTGSCLNDTAVGYQAMLNAATACNTNTAVGYQAMQGSAAYGTSSNNTAVGVNALGAIQSNMAGNTALGSQSGSVSSLLANSNNNTYLGYNAGSSGGNNPTNCTYVGANTSDVSSTSYNQSTALGCNAKITASNQIVLGTSSEAQVVIRGVPYTFPTASSAGMLQSDGSGNLSWLGDALAPLASPTISLGSGSTVSAVNLGRVNICGDATGNYTLTLPPASGNGGKFIRFQMAPTLTKLVTIAGNGSDKIDGAASRIMWANEVADLFCDGTKWTKVAGKSIPMICAIYRAAALSIANNAVTTIPFDSVISDPTGMMADVTVNRRINFQRPGTYLVQGGVAYQHLSAYTNNVQGSIRLSGTLQAQGVVTNAIASGVVTLCFGGISAVSAGQYLDQYGYQFNTEAIAVDLFVGGTVNFLSAIEILQW